jgi:outer membrane protein insertion porin family
MHTPIGKGLAAQVTPFLLAATLLAAPQPLWAAASAQAVTPQNSPPQTGQDRSKLSPSISDPNFADRPISAVSIRGLSRVTRQAIDNNIRVTAGQPFESTAIREDVSTLYRLGQFATVSAEAQLRADGTVEVIYTLVEQPIIQEIGFVGNNILSDQELKKVIPLYAGGPRDDFLLDQSIVRMKDLYRAKGNYLVEVTVDESRLKETGLLIFRVIEGPRVRIKEIEFVGNGAFDADKLYSQVKTRTSIPIFRKGELNEEQLIDDVAIIDRFYKDMGFVDVRVDRRVQLSPDSKEAKITFLIEEGRRYTLRKAIVRAMNAEGETKLRVMSSEQIDSLLVIRPGDWYAKLLLDKSVEAIKDAYGLMGYVDIDVQTESVRVGDEPQVDLVLTVREGPRSIAGLILIQGNFLTKDPVIRRGVRIQPGRPIDGRELKDAEERLKRLGISNDIRITVQRPRPADEDPLGETAGLSDEEAAAAAAASGDPEVAQRLDRQIRDILVEWKEKNTGAVNFGVGIGTDSGVFGEISLTQRNFDIEDPPLSFDELIAGRAFRGAGQYFNMTLAPGTEVSTFSIAFAEPHLFETDYGLSTRGYYRFRFYETYREDRLAGNVSVGRIVGDLWNASVNVGGNNVELTDFEDATPIEVFNDRGPNSYFSTGFSLSRTDTDRVTRPTRGTQFELSMNQFFDIDSERSWTNVQAGASIIFTIDEDYLGRKSTLKLSSDVGYIFGDDSPVYERFYRGGRSFRGFEFRTISPKSRGTIANPNRANKEPIGGEWLLSANAQYEHPLFGDMVTGVVFMDTGTITADPGIDEYRASVGLGFRLYIPQLGPVPLAFDFAIPLLKEESDNSQVFSFSAELPF